MRVEVGYLSKQMLKPAETFDDSATRVFFAAAPVRGKSSWYVLRNTKPKCQAQVEFSAAAFEPSAKQMIESLKPIN